METRSDEARYHAIADNGIDNLHGVNRLNRLNEGIPIEYIGVLRHERLVFALQK